MIIKNGKVSTEISGTNFRKNLIRKKKLFLKEELLNSSIENNSKKLYDSLPRRLINSASDNELKNFNIGIKGLTSKMPKFYTKDDLIPLYVKGIKKQPIKLIKKFLKYLKINPFLIKYIFFFNDNVSLFLIAKSKHYFEIKETLSSINKIEFLKKYNPINYDNETDIDYIYYKEIQFYFKIKDIIYNNDIPFCVKDYFYYYLNNYKFKTLDRDGFNIINIENLSEEKSELDTNSDISTETFFTQ